jgi:hypothetical protein
LIRNTRSGLTSIRVGKSKLPRVQRLALNTLLAADVKGAVDMHLFYSGILDDRINALLQGYSLRLPAMLFSYDG